MRLVGARGHLGCVLALAVMCAACGGPGLILQAHEVAARKAKPEATATIRAVPRPSVDTRRGVATPPARPGSGQAIDPSAFSPGACVSFPPTGPARHLTVFLDAGHGGLDPGGVGTTRSGRVIYESRETLAVELDAMAMLRAAGFQVVVSRTGNTTVHRLRRGDTTGRLLTIRGAHADVIARDICANEAHASILVGIYFDAGAPSDAGCVTGYDADRPFTRDNLRLARLLQAKVLTAMNARGWTIPNERVQADSGLGSSLSSQDRAYHHLVLLGPASRGYFTTPSQMPGALIEPLFITDPFEGSIADSRDGQHVIARGLADAVEQYFAPVA